MLKKGKFLVVDGLDGVGKGAFLTAFIEEAKKDGKRVFDVHQFWNKNNFHPNIKEIIDNYDVIVTSEPTFANVGKTIREELIVMNGRNYSLKAVAQAYALDRMILYQMLVLPALKAGIDVYQSRSFSTSIVYQRQSALDLGKEFSVNQILSLPGNAFCYEHLMDFLVIPTIKDVQEALRRAATREKDDNCVFENFDFQLKIKEHYESEDFKEVFTKKGVPVIYLDAGKTLEYSKQQAREFYQNYLK